MSLLMFILDVPLISDAFVVYVLPVFILLEKRSSFK